MTKFFANKIESSRDSWGDYLLEVADIFSVFDGEDFDAGRVRERFADISGRSEYAPRDFANYRDEFGAYGTYLGVFRIEKIDGRWKILLSDAARHFLCSTEPDVESFCRVQMALFQYPNGAGAVYSANGAVHAQANARDDTANEVMHSVRINPLRLICKCVVALHEIDYIPLYDIRLPFKAIFMLMNDDRINTSFSPENMSISEVLREYRTITPPDWAANGGSLTKFKRNFHIFERTGLFSRYNRGEGLSVYGHNPIRAYTYIKTISQMTVNYDGFESYYGSGNVESAVAEVISSSTWSRYFDAFLMPMQTLTALSDDLDISDIVFTAPPIGATPTIEQPFPQFRDFQGNIPRAFVASGNISDPYETIVRREKANREHARILSILAASLRLKGYIVSENTFVDLYTATDGQQFIFEVKSNNTRNTLSQIRKAIAQLYEYRYRSASPDAVLCIVLQEKPIQEWVIDYLLNDRKILLCWLVDDIRLECPGPCHSTLAQIGLVN